MSEPDFTGERLTDYLTSVVHRTVGNVVISGLPACPECGAVLNKNCIDDTWHCPDCHTHYTNKELVRALYDNYLTPKQLDGIMRSDDVTDKDG